VSIWRLPRDAVTPLPSLAALPSFAGVFVLRNLGPYARAFWWLTLGSVVATTLGYASVLVLSDVITNVATRSLHDILWTSLPLYVVLVGAGQILDSFTRRHGEALPGLYGGWFSQRSLRSLFSVDHRQLANLSRERIGTLLGVWQTHVETFLGHWFWTTSRRLAETVFILMTLWQQEPRVFAVALVVIALFLAFSLSLSSRMAPLAREQTRTTVASRALEQNLLLQLPLLQRLGADRFVGDVVGRFFAARVESMRRTRSFHANRWLAQLTIFYALYAGALFTCIVQIKQGVVGVGFIVVLRYAFDRLFLVLVFVVEQYVDLLQQREDARLLRDELGRLSFSSPPAAQDEPPWNALQLNNARLAFRPRGLVDEVVIRVPQLTLARGEHLGVLGPSGSGKTTILLQLLGLLPPSGTLTLDGRVVDHLPRRRTSYVNSTDPLLKLSLRDNILLGRTVADERLRRVLDGVCAREWVGDLDQVVGSEHFHLSAGQEQRLRLARGLVDDDVDLYLLDEPFAGLDSATRDRVLAFLGDFLRAKTVVLVTHHPEELALVDHVQRLDGGVLGNRQPAPR
jgi:ABC-type bacteriocin/lantibiotic exporter with double-glycine peptidase domain